MKNTILLKIILLLALTSLAQQTRFYSKFINLGFPAIDIGVGAEGDVAVVGTDNLVYVYDFMAEDWVRVDTFGLDHITRIDVDGDGTIYIVTGCGIYYLDCENRWIRLPGEATDIGVGVDFTVWKIGTDKIYVKHLTRKLKYLNYGVWKLICDCECLCICRRRCIRFRLRNYNPCPTGPGGLNPPKCFWFRTDGYGKNIDVYPNGDAAIAVNYWNRDFTTVKTINHHGMFFRDLLCGDQKFPSISNDITVGNTGVVFVTDYRGNVFKCHQNKKWVQVVIFQSRYYYKFRNCGKYLYANRISAGPYNQFWFTHKFIGKYNWCQKNISNMVYTSSRFFYVNFVDKNFTNNIMYRTKDGSIVIKEDGKEKLLTADGKTTEVPKDIQKIKEEEVDEENEITAEELKKEEENQAKQINADELKLEESLKAEELENNNLENGVGNSEEEVEEGPIIEEGELKTEKEEVDEEEEEELKEQKLNNKPEVKKIAKTDKGIAKK